MKQDANGEYIVLCNLCSEIYKALARENVPRQRPKFPRTEKQICYAIQKLYERLNTPVV